MDYEIKDFTDSSVKEEKRARKIKFKSASFLNIMKKFTDFLQRAAVNHVEKKLVKAKKELVETEIHRGDKLENSLGETNKENLLNKRSKKVAQLEETIHFLETGKLKPEGWVDNHAIKLKENMMKNLRENIYGIEVIPEDKKKEIFDEKNETEKVIEEETKKLNGKIGEIEDHESDKEEVQENFENITVEDVKEAVDSVFKEEEKENEPAINFEDVNNIVEAEYEIETEDVAEEDDEKVIDGKYSLTGDQIIQDADISPIKNVEHKEFGLIKTPVKAVAINEDIFNTKDSVKIEEPEKKDAKEKEESKEDEKIRDEIVITPDREESKVEKIKEDIKESEEVYNELLNNTSIDDVEKHSKLTKKMIELDEKISEEKNELNDDELKELENNEEEIYSEEESEEVKQAVEETKEIPKNEDIGFDYSDASMEDIKKAAETSTSTKDLAAMIEKIKMLRKEEKRTQEQINKAKAEQEAKERQYQETYEKFVQYGNELEERCNKNLAYKEAIVNKSKEKDDAINSMLKAMDTKVNDSQKKKK